MIDTYPDHWSFAPLDEADSEIVIMSLDEYETIRLLDKEGLKQEECAERMGVARTTITAIYESARRKIAECLVDGKILQIEGGNYRLSEQNQAEVEPKGEEEMRVAVTYDNGEVFQHFGRTETFKLYDIEDGRVMQEQVIETNGTGHGALAGFLKTAGADVLICGGLGQGAKNALAEAGIKIYAGASGNTDATVRNFIAGTLSEKGEATCDHHGHGEHEYHDCGHHDHGDHGCGHGGHCHH
jgi:predicted DNA-binding protein (UPF0251 family)/predicted Fe-Mo cluster-binding NifX family protein